MNLARPQRIRLRQQVRIAQAQLGTMLILIVAVIGPRLGAETSSVAVVRPAETPAIVAEPLAQHPLAAHARLWLLTLSSLPVAAELKTIQFARGATANWQLTLEADNTLWLSDWLTMFSTTLQQQQWTTQLVSSNSHGAGYLIVIEVNGP
ncbi:hypothetical protein CWE12_09355 [Aliidiomarina sedimenti]|uniref:Uncharacterized protein n=1 Tax=Aliidiomarina sedimenti TaxID=1933879 RepID=A0ABY0BXX3_9GAMM|nr:hypothetical protein CWE12_09355 [Aliidiomarina sedimenti]